MNEPAGPRVWGRVGLGVGLALLLGEMIAPRLWLLPHAWDPALGFTPQPDRTFRLWGEGFGSGRISQHGARTSWNRLGRPGVPAGPRGVPLLVLGDSFAEALQVGDDDLFSNRLADSLTVDGLEVAVTNAGRSAYSMADYVCRAATFTRLFAPRWVVVQVRAEDFGGDAFDPQGGNAGFHVSDQGLECDPPAPGPPPAARAPLRQWLHGVRDSLALPDRLMIALRTRLAKEGEGPPLFSAGQARLPEPPAATDDLPFEEELALLSQVWGQRVTLLYLPPFEPQAPGLATPLERQVESATQRCGLRFRSLREEFLDLAQRGRIPYGFPNTRLNEGHWNADGHAAAARILHREVLALRADGLL